MSFVLNTTQDEDVSLNIRGTNNCTDLPIWISPSAAEVKSFQHFVPASLHGRSHKLEFLSSNSDERNMSG